MLPQYPRQQPAVPDLNLAAAYPMLLGRLAQPARAEPVTMHSNIGPRFVQAVI